MKKILKVIYIFLKTIDKICEKFLKKSFLYFLKDLYEQDLYIEKQILNKKILFHVPNKITKWRIETFYEKGAA